MKNKSNKSKPTHFYAGISIAIVLFLLGLFFILFIHTQDISNLLKEKINIVVELENDADSNQLIAKLEAHDYVLPQSAKYISKDEGLAFMSNSNEVQFSGENPLQDLIVFNVKSVAYSDENLKSLESMLKNQVGVSAVFYENMILENIKSNITKVASVILLLGLVFIFLAVIIIKNTINLNMFADRAEIQTLERIGAKWAFIKMPYIKSSVMVGVKGFVIASLMLAAMLVAVSINFPTIWSTLNIFYIILSFILLFLVAIVVPALVSNAAANDYLTNKNL